MNIEQRNAATAFLFEQEPYSRIFCFCEREPYTDTRQKSSLS